MLVALHVLDESFNLFGIIVANIVLGLDVN